MSSSCRPSTALRTTLSLSKGRPSTLLRAILSLSKDRAAAAVLSVLAAIVAGSAGHLLGQSRVSSERPVGLIVDFVAVQADGMPVADLRASEVEIQINNRVRTVRSLRRVATAPAPVPSHLPAPYGTNDTIAAGRRFALVVDQESFVAGNDQLLRNAVEGLLTQLTSADQAMVVALPFGGVTLPFTSDTMRIRLAMMRLAGQGSRDETGSDLACRTRWFLESLGAFLQTQAGRPSPLTVVVFTAGLAGPRRDAPAALAPGMCELPVTHFQRITALAGAARANFYVLQPADTGVKGARWSENIAGVGSLGSDNPLAGIEHLAGVTGAERLPLDAAGTGSLLRVASESSAFYEADVQPEQGEVFGRSRSLAVRVARPGVMVRSRPEITFAKPQQSGTKAPLTVANLLASRDAFMDLPLRVGGFTVQEPGGRLRVGVLAEPVDSGVVLDSAGAVLMEDDGRIVGRWFAPDASAHPLLGAIAANPGTYRLRVAAIDKAGRPGAAEQRLDVGLTPVGPLTLSSLILGLSRAEAVGPQLDFGNEPTAIASFDIYGGAAGLPLSPTVELARDLDGPALVTLSLSLTRASESRVAATAALPIGALPPGDYVVRGIIRLEDGTTGRVVRTLRKVAR